MDKKRFSQPRYAIFLVLAVCFIMAILPQVSAFDWDTDSVSYYGLNESSGSVLDATGNGHNGTNVGATAGVAGILGTAYSFDTTKYILLQGSQNTIGINPNNWSMGMWFKTTQTGTDTHMLSNYGGALDHMGLIRMTSADKISFDIKGGSDSAIISSSTYNDGNWHLAYATISKTADNMSLYIDGDLVNTSVLPSTIVDYSTNNFSYYIGKYDGGVSFDGTIDEVAFWNKTLNSTEVLALYNDGSGLAFGTYGFKLPTIEITLSLPSNDSTISDVDTNFTTLFNISGTNTNNYTWKNATYYIWKNGVIFNTTTVSLSGNDTNNTQNIDGFTLADYKWNVLGRYGNNTYDNYTWSSSGNFTFTVGATIDSNTFDDETYETADDTFEVNITLLPGVVLQSAYLYYDDVRYIGAVTNLGSNQYSMVKTLSVPLLTGAVENKSFYWSFIYTSPIQKTQNTTTQNQTVNPIFLGLCNATYTTHALDIDIKEEGTFDDLNGTLEFSADYWLGGGDVKKEFTFSYLENDINSYDFCISPTDKTFNIDDIISYTADDYERRDYFLTNAELSNATMNLSLYLAATITTDIFTIIVQDENNNPVEGAFINVQRWDIGTNNFYTIGVIKTTSDGSGIINMRLNDAWYRFQVNYADSLYLTTEPRKESGTSRVLNINLAASNPYNQFGNIDYSLTYDEDTNVSVFTYSDTTGAVATGCLKVLKIEGNGTTEVYYSCIQSSSGTLSYEIEDDGTYIIRAIFKLTSEYDSVEQVVDEIIRQGTSARFAVIGKFGQLISLMLIGTSAMIGIAIGSIPLGLGLIGASLVLVNLLGWLNITGSVLYGLISIIILIGINLRRGR